MVFADYRRICTFAPGELAEWSIAAVLKTVDCNRSGGSNPSLSAKIPLIISAIKNCLTKTRQFLWLSSN